MTESRRRAPRMARDRSRGVERLRRARGLPRLSAAVGVGRGSRHGRLAARTPGHRPVPGRAGRRRPAAPASDADHRMAPRLRASRSGRSPRRPRRPRRPPPRASGARTAAKVATVRADPEAPTVSAYGRMLSADPWRAAPKVQPPITRIVDLTVGEEALRASLRRKHRQYVNKAERGASRSNASTARARRGSSAPRWRTSTASIG